MTIRVAINGFGRIGRNVLRALYETHHHKNMKVVAINELAEPKAVAHLLKYDTTHGRFKVPVELEDDTLIVGGDEVTLLSYPEVKQLPWGELEVDIVLDCTGVYSTREHGLAHIAQGASKVIYSHPAASDLDATIIYGINHQQLSKQHQIISNGSCTTNCIVPVIKTLADNFGIESGTITTIHASMNDQQVIDAYHGDLRRTRSASQSIIPVDTALAVGIERILPEFKGRFEAIAVRVPTVNVTAMDLSVTLNCDVDIEQVNAAIQEAKKGTLASIVDYTEEPLVSVDFNHDSHSAIVDGSQTRVSHKRLVKMLVLSLIHI